MAIVERKNKDGSITHQVKVRDPNGNWYPSETFLDPLAALTHEVELKKKRRSGVVMITQDAKNTTFNEFWEVWSQENRSDCSEGWKKSQDQMHRDYVSPAIGRLLLSKIEPKHILHALNRVRKMGRAESTVLLVYNLIQRVFGDVVGFYRMLPESPVMPKHHRPRVKETESQFLEPVDAWKLLEATRGHWAGPAVWLETLAGLRTEATVALIWSDIRWDLAQAIVRRAFKQKIRKIESFPKGKRPELVPLVQPLLEYLRELYERAVDKTGFVCQGPRGGMLKPETYGPNLKALCRQAGVPEVSAHILRHSCGELFTGVGATQEDLRRLLHHKDVKTTARYTHRTDERLMAIASRVERPKLRVVGEQESSRELFPQGSESAYAAPNDEVRDAL